MFEAVPLEAAESAGLMKSLTVTVWPTAPMNQESPRTLKGSL